VRFPSPPLLAVALALATADYAMLFHEGGAAHYRLWYYAPAAALGGAFIAERLDPQNIQRRTLAVDFVVALLCLAGLSPANRRSRAMRGLPCTRC
jgi:hypothetical protein